jgi:uncharacterized RDD family membrane protein YckC
VTVKHFRWLFLGALAVILVVCVVAEPISLGVSEEWSNGGYRFAGGTHPWALAFAALVTSLYLLLLYAVPAEIERPLPGVFRRFVAFWLDFIFAMTAVTPILGILPTLTEWRRTGAFEWAFERRSYAPGDGLLSAMGVVLASVALIFYYALPLIRPRPSPGTCIMGYQIVPEGGTTMTLRLALLRTLLGFIALSGAYVAPFVGRDRKKGKFWLDKVFGTQAVMLK